MILNTHPYDYVHEPEKANCFDCGHLKAAMSWWCKSVKAYEWRGTNQPGELHCKFWTPCRLNPKPLRIRFKEFIARVAELVDAQR